MVRPVLPLVVGLVSEPEGSTALSAGCLDTSASAGWVGRFTAAEDLERGLLRLDVVPGRELLGVVFAVSFGGSADFSPALSVAASLGVGSGVGAAATSTVGEGVGSDNRAPTDDTRRVFFSAALLATELDSVLEVSAS